MTRRFWSRVGTAAHQIDTMIHEFGHNLGQKHGGVDHSNFKPNDMSVMNYHYPLEGIGLGRAVDWDCDGTIEASVGKDLQAGDWCQVENGRSMLTDFDNWSDIRAYARTPRRTPAPSWAEPCIGWEEHRPLYERVQELRASGVLDEPVAGGARGLAVVRPPVVRHPQRRLRQPPGHHRRAVARDTRRRLVAVRAVAIAPGASQQVMVTVDLALAPPGETSRNLVVSSNDSDECPYAGGVELVVRNSGAPVLFADGFESGNTSAWSAVVP